MFTPGLVMFLTACYTVTRSVITPVYTSQRCTALVTTLPIVRVTPGCPAPPMLRTGPTEPTLHFPRILGTGRPTGH